MATAFEKGKMFCDKNSGKVYRYEGQLSGNHLFARHGEKLLLTSKEAQERMSLVKPEDYQ